MSEIIVTAQRRPEDAGDVPMSLDALGAEDLRDAGADGLGDLGMLVPGLSVDDAAGYLLVHLRGVGSVATGPGIENPVALYVDGVYYGNQSLGMAPFNKVERVEVLKGPQGALFGRNATGGLIHIVTADPAATPRFDTCLSAGNFGAVEASVDASGPLGPGLAGDLAVRFGRHGGYGRNLVADRSVHRLAHDLAARTKLLLTTGALRATLVADISDRIDSDGALPNVKGSRVFPGGPPVDYPDPWDIRHDRKPRLHARYGGASLKVEVPAGPFDATSILAWRASRLDDNFDYDGSEFPLVGAHLLQRDRQFSEELQLRSNKAGAVGWVAGFYGFQGRGSHDPLIVDLASDPAFNPQLPLVRLVATGTERTRSISLFGQAEWSIRPRLTLTAGLRQTWERRSMTARRDGVLALPGEPVVPVDPPVSPSKRFQQPTFRLALDYQAGRETMVYASVGSGFKSGGFNVAEPSSPFFRSERLIAYEIGAKFVLLRRKLRINAALFHYDYRRIQVVRAGETSIGFSSGPAARLSGAEIEAKWLVGPSLDLTADLAVLDATYGHFPDALIGAEGGGVPLATGDATGNRVPYSPKTTIGLGATYHHPIGSGRLVLNATWRYRSKYYFEPDNVIAQPGAGLLNALARIEWNGADRWVSLFGRNLADRALIRAALTIPSGQQISRLAAPRTFGIEFGIRY